MTQMKIKYVQLESDAFLTDLDFIMMTPAERGLYCSLIFFLNSNGGKCEFACLNFHCRPEIQQWIQQMYLFPPIKNDLAHQEKESQENVLSGTG